MLRSGEQRSAKARFSRTVTSERWSNRFTHGLGDSAGAGRFERRAPAGSGGGSQTRDRNLPNLAVPFFEAATSFSGSLILDTLITREYYRASPAGGIAPNK